ncbi:hypothetical protein [Bradyrhizobium sp. AZCC 2289]|uniref:hypothetical protein n=1 Tax=Bradyrhizobium sp. AZCC 2289 TaxID=3117026 RepID=UPI002FF25495
MRSKATLKLWSVATALGLLPVGRLAAQEAYPVQASITYSPQVRGSNESFYNRFCNDGDMYLGFARDKSDLAQKVARFCGARDPGDWVATFPQGVTLVFSLTSKGGYRQRRIESFDLKKLRLRISVNVMDHRRR